MVVQPPLYRPIRLLLYRILKQLISMTAESKRVAGSSSLEKRNMSEMKHDAGYTAGPVGTEGQVPPMSSPDIETSQRDIEKTATSSAERSAAPKRSRKKIGLIMTALAVGCNARN